MFVLLSVHVFFTAFTDLIGEKESQNFYSCVCSCIITVFTDEIGSGGF